MKTEPRFFAALSPDVLVVVVIFAALFLAVLVFFGLYLHREGKKRREIEHYGDRAEQTVADFLLKAFPHGEVFHDVYLKTPHGLTQIDHILICRWGVYVIETKSHNGLIITGKKEWVQKYRDKTIRFYSPVLQNESHRRALESLLENEKSLKGVRVTGIVVFTSKNVRFSGSTEKVLRLDQLNAFVKSGEEPDPALRKSKVRPLTAKARRKYLDRQQITLISRLVSKNCEKSRVKQHLHREKVRDFGIYRRIRK